MKASKKKKDKKKSSSGDESSTDEDEYQEVLPMNMGVKMFNNYPPKWRWIAVDVYRAAKRGGKYPPLVTDT